MSRAAIDLNSRHANCKGKRQYTETQADLVIKRAKQESVTLFKTMCIDCGKYHLRGRQNPVKRRDSYAF